MLRIAFALIISAAVSSSVAEGQRASDITVAFASGIQADSTNPSSVVTASPRPRWIKAAVIGAVGGGLAFAAMHWMAGDYAADSMERDILNGVLLGGVSAGVAIGFYDWVCAPNSASDRAGLCSGLYNRQTRHGDSSRGPMMRIR